jgi:thiamine thiazole synthase
MEEKITSAIIARYFEKLRAHLSVDVAVVGAGPSGLVAAACLGRAGRKVAVFERALAPGGGVWGGGMLFNEIVIQESAVEILRDFGITFESAGQGLYTADSIEVASALILTARKAGAVIFNCVTVEDVVFKHDRVAGVVINWTPVNRLAMHVDPLVVTARAVLDSTGHTGEIVQLAVRKAGIRINTPTGQAMGEKPMWAESGEASTVENTRQLYPGLYASGMAANNASGGFRMGPIFGGMLLSGAKAARVILEDLDAR